ncbi:tetratricopeptide repeat protein [Bacteroidales bacterium AH-315-N07]|nr:tetratricopeptide repeat protein [Bacteroidales bacterium AH-315-N07]
MGKKDKKIKRSKQISKSGDSPIPKVKEIGNISFDLPYDSASIFRRIFFITAGLILIILTFLCFDAGINGDEQSHAPRGQDVLNFYLTLGEDTTAIKETGANRYGGLFEVIATGLNKIIGLEDHYLPAYHDTRHLVNVLFGFLVLFFTGLITKEIAGWRAGCLSLIFFLASPRFIGHSFFNPNDIPFATGYVIFLYYVLRFCRELPQPSLSNCIGVIAGIAVSLNTRSGGLLLVAYFLFFTFCTFIVKHGYKNIFSNGPIGKYVKYAAIIVFAGIIAGVLFWPYGLLNPFLHPIKVLSEVTNYFEDIKVLFKGNHYGSVNVPWYYAPNWMLITIPLHILIGFLLFFILIGKFYKRYNTLFLFIILFALFFPILYLIYQKSTLYDGWRHTLFIYPTFIVLSALSYEFCLKLIKKPLYKYGLIAILALIMLEPISWMFRNHPHEYVYFNPLIDGIDGAYGYYETDYWMNSIKQASEWLIKSEKLNEIDKPIIIATNCWYPAKVYLGNISDKIKVVYTKYYHRKKIEWDYGLFISRFVNKNQLQQNIWPPKITTIHTIKADNSPLCAILKNEDNSTMLGHEALKNEERLKSIEYFKKAIKYDPYNEDAFQNLGLAHIFLENFDEAIKYLTKSVEIYSDNSVVWNLMAFASNNSGKFDEAIKYCNEALKVSPRFEAAYNNLGMAYIGKGDVDKGIKSFTKCVELQPDHLNALTQLEGIYRQLNNGEMAKIYRDRINNLR